MITLILSLLLIFGLLAIDILEHRKPSVLWNRLNLSLTGAGLLMILICRLLASLLIGNSGGTALWKEWAEDMFSQHYVLSLPVLAVLLGILLLSWLFSITGINKRYGQKQVSGRFLRRSVGLLSSCTMLLLASLYSYTTENDTISLETLIFVSGIGEALLFRLVNGLEGLLRQK